MANIYVNAQKGILDWMFNGAAAPTIAGRFLGLSLAAPTSIAFNEPAAGSGYVRSSCAFGAAGTPSGSGTATNASAITFGPFSSSCVINGLIVADSVSIAGGIGLVYGNLSVARTPLIGDYVVVASAALTVTMA